MRSLPIRPMFALLLPLLVAIAFGSVSLAQLSPSGQELLQRQKDRTDRALSDQLRQRQQQIRDRQQDDIRQRTQELMRRQNEPANRENPYAVPPRSR